MELNKEYVVESENIQEIMFQVSEFITLLEKFKTFNINKDYKVEINKIENHYKATLIVVDNEK